jgi:hypothetical protein
VNVNVNNVAVPAGLVLSFGFNEGSGSTVTDSSGTGNNGTTSSTTWNSTGKFGKALSFNGTSSWVTVNDSNSLDLTNGMTLEAWVKPSSLADWSTVIMKQQTGGLVYSLYAATDVGVPSTFIFTTAEQSQDGPAALPLNTWTHLAATYDGANLRLYVNGNQVASKAQTGNIKVSGAALRIGGNSSFGEYFKGLIDEVHVYNRALSQAEIQTDMNTPLP